MNIMTEIIRKKIEVESETMVAPTDVYLGAREYRELLGETQRHGIDTKPTTAATVYGMRVHLVNKDSHFNVC